MGPEQQNFTTSNDGFLSTIKKKFKGRHRLVSSKDFKLTIVLSLLITILWSGLLLLIASEVRVGPEWEDTKGAAEDVVEAGASFAAAIALPAVIMFYLSLNVDAWRILVRERVYRWQGWASVGLVVVLCLFISFYMLYVTMFATYGEMAELPNGEEQFYVKGEMQLLARVQGLCTFTSWPLAFATALGFFARNETESFSGSGV